MVGNTFYCLPLAFIYRIINFFPFQDVNFSCLYPVFGCIAGVYCVQLKLNLQYLASANIPLSCHVLTPVTFNRERRNFWREIPNVMKICYIVYNYCIGSLQPFVYVPIYFMTFHSQKLKEKMLYGSLRRGPRVTWHVLLVCVKKIFIVHSRNTEKEIMSRTLQC